MRSPHPACRRRREIDRAGGLRAQAPSHCRPATPPREPHPKEHLPRRPAPLRLPGSAPPRANGGPLSNGHDPAEDLHRRWPSSGSRSCKTTPDAIRTGWKPRSSWPTGAGARLLPSPLWKETPLASRTSKRPPKTSVVGSFALLPPETKERLIAEATRQGQIDPDRLESFLGWYGRSGLGRNAGSSFRRTRTHHGARLRSRQQRCAEDRLCLQKCFGAGLRLRGDASPSSEAFATRPSLYKSVSRSESCEMVEAELRASRDCLSLRGTWRARPPVNEVRRGVGEDTAAGVSSPASPAPPTPYALHARIPGASPLGGVRRVIA
jgi:hypothetical protein